MSSSSLNTSAADTVYTLCCACLKGANFQAILSDTLQQNV